MQQYSHEFGPNCLFILKEWQANRPQVEAVSLHCFFLGEQSMEPGEGRYKSITGELQNRQLLYASMIPGIGIHDFRDRLLTTKEPCGWLVGLVR